MKKETQLDKLNKILGLSKKAEEVKTKSTGKVVGVSEKEIQNFRQAQGLIYFLQAPALFTPKVCKHCGENFLVSRKYVGYCSYNCIKNSLAKLGIEWKKGDDIEALVMDPQVYNGNEPLWIREPMLTTLREMLSKLPENSESSNPTLSPPNFVPPDTSTESTLKENTTSSSAPTTMQSGTPTKPTLKRKPKRRIISTT